MILCTILIVSLVPYIFATNIERINPLLFSAKTTVDRVRSEGYPIEEHYVQTADGYILNVHRIPYSKMAKKPNRNQNRPAILLMHGLLSSSSDWILPGPGRGLAYILSDAGYDVWMGNNRGNFYSRNHAWLSTNSKKFWDFSWNEIGSFDISAKIDYILERTNQTALHYIGHSQGTTVFFVLTSLRPEYNKKIKSMHALGPVSYCSSMPSPFIRIVAILPTEGVLVDLLGKSELLPRSEFLAKISKVLCKDESLLQEVCANIVFLITGFNTENLNRTMIPDIISTIPAGAATKQIIHFVQLFKSKKFRMYDYGLIRNKLIYGALSPPNYDLKRITVPVSLYYGNNDWLAGVEDVQKLAAQLGNLQLNYKIPHNKWNHMDFLWGINVKELLYDKLLEMLNKFD